MESHWAFVRACFSGVLCIDEVHDSGRTILFATDPLNNFYLCRLFAHFFVREGVAVMHAQKALGDFVEAEMIESFGELAFEVEALDGGVSKGNGHRRSSS